MKKSDQTPKEEFDHLPLLPPDDWRFLWEDNYWDGPVSGMLLHNDEKLYFMMYEDSEYDESSHGWTDRTFTVHRLKPKVLALQIYWHDMFVELVGAHCTYDEHGKQSCDFNAKEKPYAEVFYERRKEEYEPNEPDLDDPEVAELVARIEW